MLLLTGCESELPYDAEWEVFLIGETSVTTGMVNTLFYAFENELYEENSALYGDDFWNATVYEDPEITYAEYEKEYIFYENTLNMFILANLWSEDNTLSEEQISEISGYADSYMEQISDETLEFLGVSEDEIYTLCEACYLALLEQDEISEDVSTVISEEEIRVITVFEAYFETEEEATGFVSGLDEGGDASSLSSAATKTLTENLTREDIDNEDFLDEIFSIKEGEHTGIISTDEGYLVAVLTDSYQDEMSEDRREELILERKKEALSEICEEYLSETDVYVSEELWDMYELKTEELAEDVGLIYEIYAEMSEG